MTLKRANDDLFLPSAPICAFPISRAELERMFGPPHVIMTDSFAYLRVPILTWAFTCEHQFTHLIEASEEVGAAHVRTNVPEPHHAMTCLGLADRPGIEWGDVRVA